MKRKRTIKRSRSFFLEHGQLGIMVFFRDEQSFRIGPDDSSDFIFGGSGIQKGFDVLSADNEGSPWMNGTHFILGRSGDDGKTPGDAAVIFREVLKDATHEQDGFRDSD